MIQYAKERDKVFTAFVMDDDIKNLKAFCKKYGQPMPKDKRVLACGVYKAVQYCTNIPEEVKAVAMEKCLKLGMSPFIDGIKKEVES